MVQSTGSWLYDSDSDVLHLRGAEVDQERKVT